MPPPLVFLLGLLVDLLGYAPVGVDVVILLLVHGIALRWRRRQVVTGARRTAFDYLVVAAGAGHAYFGHDEWAAYAPGLKSLEDALGMRARVLTAMEAAETACDPAERARLLTFVVVGGGPTGVELAGAIAELTGRALARDFRTIRGAMARVLLVEAGPRLLPNFHPSLSASARKALTRLGVEVRLGAAVSASLAGGLIVAGGYDLAFLVLAAIASGGLALYLLAMPETARVRGGASRRGG